MKKLTICTLCMPFLMFGCANVDHAVKADTNSTEYIFWVNSLKAECTGAGPMQCLQIQTGDTPTADGWQLFYDTIKGFKYKQGYMYKIRVQEEAIPAEEVPADASSKKYTLIKILEKKVDGKLRLHDIWALESIKGEQLHVAQGHERPRLEINLKKMALLGNDGCNDFLGRIAAVDAQQLIFGPLAGTMKACSDMDIPDRFHRHINNTRNYAIKGLKLYLFDSQGNELFRFQKID
jgi:heat shock protein HslJ